MDSDSSLELLTLEEVADFCRKSVGTVRYWVKMRILKSIKLGRSRVVRKSDLIAHLEKLESIS